MDYVLSVSLSEKVGGRIKVTTVTNERRQHDAIILTM